MGVVWSIKKKKLPIRFPFHLSYSVDKEGRRLEEEISVRAITFMYQGRVLTREIMTIKNWIMQESFTFAREFRERTLLNTFRLATENDHI